MQNKIREKLETSGQVKKVEIYTTASGDKQVDIKIRFGGAEALSSAFFAQLQENAIVDLIYNPDKNK